MAPFNRSAPRTAPPIAVAPILVIYLFFQRYLVSGLTSGAIRG